MLKSTRYEQSSYSDFDDCIALAVVVIVVITVITAFAGTTLLILLILDKSIMILSSLLLVFPHLHIHYAAAYVNHYAVIMLSAINSSSCQPKQGNSFNCFATQIQIF